MPHTIVAGLASHIVPLIGLLGTLRLVPGNGGGHDDLQDDGGIVEYSDTPCQQEMSARPTISARRGQNVVELAGIARARYAKQRNHGAPLRRGEAVPEIRPSDLVGAINELADRWAAWRHFPAK